MRKQFDYISIEDMEVDCDDSKIVESSEARDSNVSENYLAQNESLSHLSVIESSSFKENELYHFLNSSLKGQMILGKFKERKILDYTALKDLVIYKKISEDPFNYKIKSRDFIKLRDQIKELFPTEDPDFFYVSSTENKENESVSARGSLYNYYKVVRKDLRDAGILSEKNVTCSKNDDSSRSNDNFTSLTQKNRETCTLAETLKDWECTYEDRMKLLQRKEKKTQVVSIETYFASFPCLSFPLGVILLEQDFKKVILNLTRNSSLIEEAPDYTAVFSTKWPTLAHKIILHCKKSKACEVKRFLELHKDLIEAGSHDSILALLLLPLIIRTVKKIKFEVTKSEVTLTKLEILKCFILHVEDSNNLSSEQNEFETWLKNLQQEIHPYVILCGKLESPQIPF